MIERNVGEIILDGSRDWIFTRVEGEVEGKTARFLLSTSKIPNIDDSNFSINKIANIMCDKYTPTLVEDLVYTETKGIGFTKIYLSIRDKTMTIDEFKEKLKNNNVKLLYLLKDKEYEPLNIDSNINLFKKNNICI